MITGGDNMANGKSNPNGWAEWSKFVLKELERLNNCYEKLDSKVGRLETKINNLYMKLGAVSGTVALVVSLIVLMLGVLIKR